MRGAYGNTLAPEKNTGQLLITKECLPSGIALDALDNPCMKKALKHLNVQLQSVSHLNKYITPIINEDANISNNVLGFE